VLITTQGTICTSAMCRCVDNGHCGGQRKVTEVVTVGNFELIMLCVECEQSVGINGKAFEQ
jgi:hypothetical protein